MTYITNNLIGILFLPNSPSAMGYPGNPQTRKTQTSVNKMDMTAYYLDAHHPNHYKLFNLAEETYDALIFHDMVALFHSSHAGGELQLPRLPRANARSPHPHLHVDRVLAVRRRFQRGRGALLRRCVSPISQTGRQGPHDGCLRVRDGLDGLVQLARRGTRHLSRPPRPRRNRGSPLPTAHTPVLRQSAPGGASVSRGNAAHGGDGFAPAGYGAGCLLPLPRSLLPGPSRLRLPREYSQGGRVRFLRTERGVARESRGELSSREPCCCDCVILPRGTPRRYCARNSTPAS